ncbi:MAG: discoidin domain-containing protein [Thermoflexales bacterium]
MPKVLIKRGTRAQLLAPATAGQLAAGEMYLITDEDRLAVGLSASAYQALLKTGEASNGSITIAALSTSIASGQTVSLSHVADPEFARSVIVYEYIGIESADVIPVMTAQTTGGCTITASTWATGYDPWRVANSSTIDYWASSSCTPWLQIAFTAPQTVAGYSIRPRADYNDIGPKSWILKGSNDGGATWDTLDTRTAVPINGGVRAEFLLPSAVSYSTFMLSVTACWNPGYSVPVCISDFELLAPGDTLYKRAADTAYEISCTPTQTRVKRLASGTVTVKIAVRI